MPDLVDVEVANNGSFFTFLPITPRAIEWFDKNTPDATRYNNSIAVDHRYARDIADALVNEGMVLR